MFDDLEAGGVEVCFAAGVEVAKLVDGGLRVGAEVELVSKLELGAIAMERGGGKAHAEIHVELLLDVREGGVAEEVVNVLELLRAEMGELGERLEGVRARARGFLMYDF